MRTCAKAGCASLQRAKHRGLYPFRGGLSQKRPRERNPVYTRGFGGVWPWQGARDCHFQIDAPVPLRTANDPYRVRGQTSAQGQRYDPRRKAPLQRGTRDCGTPDGRWQGAFALWTPSSARLPAVWIRVRGHLLRLAGEDCGPRVIFGFGVRAATNREQWYVTNSRGRKSVRVLSSAKASLQ